MLNRQLVSVKEPNQPGPTHQDQSPKVPDCCLITANLCQ